MSSVTWNTPNLQWLEINSFQDFEEVNMDNFRTLNDLSIKDLTNFPGDTFRSSLKRLSLFDFEDTSGIDEISKLEHLEELTIEVLVLAEDEYRWKTPSARPTRRLELGKLRRLSLSSYAQLAVKINLQAPMLRTLCVQHQSSLINSIINAEPVEWILQESSESESTFAVASLGSATQLTLQNVVDPADSGPLKDAKLPPTLETLHLEMESGEVERYSKSYWS